MPIGVAAARSNCFGIVGSIAESRISSRVEVEAPNSDIEESSSSATMVERIASAGTGRLIRKPWALSQLSSASASSC